MQFDNTKRKQILFKVVAVDHVVISQHRNSGNPVQKKVCHSFQAVFHAHPGSTLKKNEGHSKLQDKVPVVPF